MKHLLITLLLSLVATTAVAQKSKAPQGVTYEAQIVRVSDGDTIVIAAAFLPAPLKPELAVRIYGVDTPEKGFRAKCPAEDQRGQAASAFTKKMVETSKSRQVTIYSWDKFGGRVLGAIILDGVDLRTELIRNGFAIPYFGEKKEHDWCK
jgi:endonuclease YncB( thermonuclease family)